jgi:PAS domain S-box-containing protein
MSAPASPAIPATADPRGGVAMFVFDTAGRIHDVNSGVEPLLGYRPADLIGQYLSLLVPRRLRRRYASEFKDLVVRHRPGDPAATLAVIVLGREGHEVSVFVSLSSFDAGSRRLFSATVTDLVEMAARREALPPHLARLEEMTTDLRMKNEALETVARQLRAMISVAREVSRARTPTSALESIVGAAITLQGASAAVLWIVDEAPRRLRRAAFVGAHPEAFQLDLAFGEGAAGWVAQHRLPVWIPDVTRDPRASGRDPWRAQGFQALYGIPILEGDQMLAVLCVAYTHPSLANLNDDLLRAFGDQAGVALRNAKLYERLQQLARELEERNEELRIATDLKLASLQLIQMNRIKTRFLANASHELRTPLSSIMGFLRLVLDGLCDDRTEEREFIRNAHTSAQHLLSVINDFLDVAKIEAGALTLSPEPVRLGTLFAEVRTISEIQARERGLTLTFTPPPEPADLVRADPARVTQVLLNLVGNAIKFTPSGGVTVCGAARPDVGLAVVTVRDTGVGIDTGKLHLLFQSFVQLDNSTTRRFGGTGLGLAISKSLVEAMGGTIRIDSAGAGTGTVVTFTLPLARVGEAGLPIEEEGRRLSLPEGPEQAPVVFVVEDDPMFASYLRALFRREGFAVATARTADDAFEGILRVRPALITVDIGLPKREGARLVTGPDLIAALVAESDLAQIPIAVISGQTDLHGPSTGAGSLLSTELGRLSLVHRTANILVVRKQHAEDLLALIQELRQLAPSRAVS